MSELYHSPEFTACPFCGQQQDGATNIGSMPGAPAAGDYGICWACGEVTVYTGRGFERRKPNEAELDRVRTDPELRQVVQQARLYQARFGEKR